MKSTPGGTRRRVKAKAVHDTLPPQNGPSPLQVGLDNSLTDEIIPVENIESSDPEETLIGEGGYAHVARRGDIAVKRIPWMYLESAVRELIFIKSCSHECIIRIAGIESEPKSVVLLMKYYPSVLSTYKVRGLADIVSITYGLLSACKYIHELGIIHCDIKCDNILIEHSSAPKPILCDFGISLRVEERQHVGSVQTVTYRAPEVDFTSTTKLHTPAIDVWSVGAVLYRVITGRAMYVPNGSEDSSIYAAKFFGISLDSAANTRKNRLKQLYKLKSITILELLLKKFRADANSLIYMSGLAETIALMLHPNPEIRTPTEVLFKIVTRIIKQSFPEIKYILSRFCEKRKPNIKIRDRTYSIDELSCVVNVPIEVIGSCSEDCLNCAEMLYEVYTAATGVYRLEVSLACIYIASATYCDSNALRAILTVMDLEQIQKYVITILQAV